MEFQFIDLQEPLSISINYIRYNYLYIIMRLYSEIPRATVNYKVFIRNNDSTYICPLEQDSTVHETSTSCTRGAQSRGYYSLILGRLSAGEVKYLDTGNAQKEKNRFFAFLCILPPDHVHYHNDFWTIDSPFRCDDNGFYRTAPCFKQSFSYYVKNLYSAHCQLNCIPVY